MSRRRNCWDNAVAESFFGSLKKERIRKRIYRSRREANADLFDYIDMFYNRTRRHSYLGGVSPEAFEEASLRLTIAAGDAAARAQTLTQIQALPVQPDRAPRVVIDGRDGTIVSGGTITVGEAMVSHDGLTLAIDATPPAATAPGELRLAAGASIQDVASALYAVGATPSTLASVFEALHRVGALNAELVVR